jgi:hypothetical protein
MDIVGVMADKWLLLTRVFAKPGLDVEPSTTNR